ncbi:MAG: motility-associated protein [Pseudomonadota bacterium]
MTQVLGFLIVMALIAGGLLFSGTSAVFAALPFELALIGGAAFGTLLIGNSWAVASEAMRGIGLALTGSRWRQKDYTELFALLNDLLVTQFRRGALALEADIEAPGASPRFQAAPRVLLDADVTAQICDAFRLLALGSGAAGRMEQHLERSCEAVFHRRMQAVTALRVVADALPALGIVAAVLGIIKTMSAIDQSNAVIGAMIATALMGTFLGVFLAYGLVGPLANRFGQVVEEEIQALEVVKIALSTAATGASPRLALETARAAVPHGQQPSVADFDKALAYDPPLRVVA